MSDPNTPPAETPDPASPADADPIAAAPESAPEPTEATPADSASEPPAAADAAPEPVPAMAPAAAEGLDENTLLLELKDGTVTIELRPDLAPLHCERIRMLARQGFYDGTPFHRVIEGFMAQGGDPTGSGTGGARDLPDLKAEFSPPGKARFLKGTCGMARTAAPDSASSQFFIMFAPAPSLDGQYTIWGRVVSGMEAVDKIKRGSGGNGMVQGPDRVIRARLAPLAAAG